MGAKVILFANTDWYLYNFRRSLALELQHRGYELLLISPAGEYGQKLRNLGLRWEPVPMDRRSLNPLREVLLLARLLKIFRREKPLLVHGFTIKGAVYGSLAARLANVVARVNAVDGMGYVYTSSDLKARLLRPITSALLRTALGGPRSRLILLNPDDVKFFRESGLIDSRQVTLIPGAGVDCSRFAGFSQKSSGAKPLRVLLAARLLKDKGLLEYVEASRMLHAEGRPVHFLLAGTPDPGNPSSIPESTVRGWVKEGLIDWLGHVSDMPALYGSVDVVALPSYREGLPTTLIEGAACGLPLVAADVPGCREVITDGVDGLLIPVRDSSALARAIATLQDRPDFAARLGQAARSKALAEYDERIVIEKTIAVYRELLPA